MKITGLQLARSCAKLGFKNSDMNTVSELLETVAAVIKKAPGLKPEQRRRWMQQLERSAAVICRSVGKKQMPDRMPISDIILCEADMRKQLPRNPVKAMRTRHFGQWQLLRQFAKALGFAHEVFAIEREWEQLKFIGMDSTAERLINSLKHDTISPKALTQEHIETWKQKRRAKHQGLIGLEQSISQLKYRIRQAKLQFRFPKLNVDLVTSRYSVPMKKMRVRVRKEIAAILDWLAEQDSREVIQKCEVTRRGFTGHIERLYGYAVGYYPSLCGTQITSLNQILTRKVIQAYVRWLHKERGCERGSLGKVICSLHSVLKIYPAFEKRDWTWMGKLVDEFREEPESQVEARRKERAFDYDMETLSTIPDLIRKERELAKGLTEREKGLSIRDETLTLFLVGYPWPPRCLRECSIEGIARNLEKKSKTEGAPKEWHFYFRPEEVPQRRLAKGPLPKKLVPQLDLYLKYRSRLLRGKDPGTLFLNENGRPFSSGRLYVLVCKITRNFVGRRVPPVAFRDAHAYDWLLKHKGDYGTLASLRWESEYCVRMRFDRDFRNAERAKRRTSKRSG
jgi:hypothetical protein